MADQDDVDALYGRRWTDKDRESLRQCFEVSKKGSSVIVNNPDRRASREMGRDLSDVSGAVEAIRNFNLSCVPAEELARYREVVSRKVDYDSAKQRADAIRGCIMGARLASPKVYFKCLDGSSLYTPEQAELVYAALREKFVSAPSVDNSASAPSPLADIPAEDDPFA